MNDQSSQVTDSSQLQMSQLLLGFMATQAIHVAAKLGIADLVRETPKTADELALATQTHGPSLQRLLHMLTGVGIFAEDAAGRFRHTPLSETLRRDHHQSLRNVAVMWGGPFLWRPWGELYERGERALSAGKTEELHQIGDAPAGPFAFNFQGTFARVPPQEREGQPVHERHIHRG